MKIITLLLPALLFVSDTNQPPEVFILRSYWPSEFSLPENFLFDYNVYDDDGDYLTVLFQLSSDGGKTWYTPRNVSGDMGHRIRSQIVPPLYERENEDSLRKDFYSIVWELPKEPWWLLDFDNLRWRITADDHFERPRFLEWVTVPVDHEEIHNADHDEKKFHIMKYEVTNAQYVKFLNTAYKSGLLSVTNDWVGYYVENETVPMGDALCFVNQDTQVGNLLTIRWDGEHFFISEKHRDFPVVFVTHKGAQAFADFNGWQLPDSAQWFRSALGSHRRPFPWGSYVEYQQANFWDSQDPFDNGPTPSGFYDGRISEGFKTWDSPGWYGCYDMVGNVGEWLRDSTVAGSSWYTTNPRHISSQSPSHIFDTYGADFQTGFRCVSEFFGR